jgi:GT2 family glycosyltransferase
MKFSLVITTYNRLELLKRAIACGLNQTVSCEVVVDDAIAQHPQAVLCSSQAIQVDEHGTELRRTPATGPGQVFYISQAALRYGMLMDQIPFGTPAQVAARRDAFLHAGGWDPTMTTNYDDIDAWVKLAEYGDALFINECLAYRTLWPGGHEPKMSLAHRRALNFTIKQRIYGRGNEGYRDRIPSLTTLARYLHLHWGLVALRQRQIAPELALLAPAVLSPQAWKLLAQARQLRATAPHGLVPRPVLTR